MRLWLLTPQPSLDILLHRNLTSLLLSWPDLITSHVPQKGHQKDIWGLEHQISACAFISASGHSKYFLTNNYEQTQTRPGLDLAMSDQFFKVWVTDSRVRGGAHCSALTWRLGSDPAPKWKLSSMFHHSSNKSILFSADVHCHLDLKCVVMGLLAEWKTSFVKPSLEHFRSRFKNPSIKEVAVNKVIYFQKCIDYCYLLMWCVVHCCCVSR